MAYFTDTPTVSTSVDGLDAAPWFTCAQAVAVDPTPEYATLEPYFYYALNEAPGSTQAATSGSLQPAGGFPLNAWTSAYSFGAGQPCARDTNAGSPDTALSLSGGWFSTEDVLSLPPPQPSWNDLTLSLWFRSTGGGTLIGLNRYREAGPASNNDRTIYVDGTGTVYFGVGGPPVTLSSASGNYLDGEWHMATASLSSVEGMKLYVDGNLEASNTTTSGRGYPFAYWVVGNGRNNGEWPGTGTLDSWYGDVSKVGIWDRVLSDQDIFNLYRSALPVNP